MHYKVWNIIFLQMPGAGWITVKKTSRAPSVAMESLKLPVDLIKTISGTMALHKSLKTEFEPHSVSGHDDWYSPVPELLARIDSIEDYDGGEPPPPPPEPEAPRHYEDPYYYCSGCNDQFDEYEKDDLITVGEDYTDYGEVHLYGSLEHGHLCRRCALGGGLTNIIYPIFYENRMSLSPYWEQSDESFLSKCS